MMMKLTKPLRRHAAVLAMVLVLAGCKKNGGDYTYVNSVKTFTGNTYDYLKSKPGVFDSLLFVVDKLKLTDTLKQRNVTLFACTNASFQQVVSKLNIARALAGKRPVYLNDMAPNLLDSIVCRYIIRGKYIADSLALIDGRMLKSARYAYPMNGRLSTANATGYTSGGPAVVVFSFTKNSLFTRDWSQATANSINISTANGVIHILDPSHPFGFGEYSKPTPSPFTASIFRPAGYAGPFLFPAAIGGSLLIEAEDYDAGGPGVGYFDTTVGNAGNNYRATENVDIDAPHNAGTDAYGAFPSSFNIGSVVAGEWLLYTVNVPVEGDFTLTARVASNGSVDPKRFHIEIDGKNVSGTMSFLKNNSWVNFNIVLTGPVVHIPAGSHTMRFFCETGDFNYTNYVVKRVN